MITINILTAIEMIYKVLLECCIRLFLKSRKLPQRSDIMEKRESSCGRGVPVYMGEDLKPEVTVLASLLFAIQHAVNLNL